MSDSKNDAAWEQLFEKYLVIHKIEENGFFIIKSTSINEFREARLMTKFDYKSQLPKLFVDNNLSILPISRGDYIISDMKTFHNFTSEEIEPKKIEFPDYIESINIENISSEATALNCAYLSDIISDFTGDENLKPTVSGRMSSKHFSFKIDTIHSSLNITVGNSQIEIDGGYEGINSLCLFEAKNIISSDFVIRQLYYPYRLWINKIKKKVRPIFLTYTNGIFHLREYAFDDPYYYNSIRLINQKKYSLTKGVINLEIIQKILRELTISEEPQIPFPQANSFERVLNLCELLNEKNILNKNQITYKYNFEGRQTQYYTDAGRYLGLIEKAKEAGLVQYKLTELGKLLFQMSLRDRQLGFVKSILSHSVFNKVLKLYLEKVEPPSIKEIVEVMKICNLYNIDSEKTYYRRASTISKWINWILELIEI